jgi:DNA-binding MarR family transcriptional regulator
LPEIHAAYEADPARASARAAAVERLVAGFDEMMSRIALVHASEFLEVGLTMSQAKVLYLVQAGPNLRMSELAGRLAVSLSTMSGVVDRLVDLGMLTRHDDPANRRQVVIRITPSGIEHIERLRELNAGQLRLLLARVADSDLALIERALAILSAAAPGPAGGTSASRTIEGDPA